MCCVVIHPLLTLKSFSINHLNRLPLEKQISANKVQQLSKYYSGIYSCFQERSNYCLYVYITYMYSDTDSLFCRKKTENLPQTFSSFRGAKAASDLPFTSGSTAAPQTLQVSCFCYSSNLNQLIPYRQPMKALTII